MKFATVLMGVAILVTGVIAVGLTKLDEVHTSCEKAGGYLVSTTSGHVCARLDVIPGDK